MQLEKPVKNFFSSIMLKLKPVCILSKTSIDLSTFWVAQKPFKRIVHVVQPSHAETSLRDDRRYKLDKLKSSLQNLNLSLNIEHKIRTQNILVKQLKKHPLPFERSSS